MKVICSNAKECQDTVCIHRIPHVETEESYCCGGLCYELMLAVECIEMYCSNHKYFSPNCFECINRKIKETLDED